MVQCSNRRRDNLPHGEVQKSHIHLREILDPQDSGNLSLAKVLQHVPETEETMPAAFPHEYKAKITWKKDREGLLEAASQPAILGGPPPQFDGSAEYWSPEELLLSSVQLCLMTTFQALLAKTPVKLQSYESEIRGLLDKTKDGIRFTQIRAQVRLSADDQQKAEEMLLKSKKYCIISNALNVPVELVIDRS